MACEVPEFCYLTSVDASLACSGAAREYPREFVDDYLRMVRAVRGAQPPGGHPALHAHGLPHRCQSLTWQQHIYDLD